MNLSPYFKNRPIYLLRASKNVDNLFYQLNLYLEGDFIDTKYVRMDSRITNIEQSQQPWLYCTYRGIEYILDDMLVRAYTRQSPIIVTNNQFAVNNFNRKRKQQQCLFSSFKQQHNSILSALQEYKVIILHTHGKYFNSTASSIGTFAVERFFNRDNSTE